MSSYKTCIGCGWCCLNNPCMESHRLYGYMPRCPDLLWDHDQNRYICLLMLDPVRGQGFREALHSGQGCCAPLNDWREDVRDREID